MAYHVKLLAIINIFVVLLAIRPHDVHARKHKLHLSDDSRRLIHITSFGFFKGGFMEVNVHEIYLQPPVTPVKGKDKRIIGFTVDRTLKDGINPYPHDVESTCAIAPRHSLDESSSSILFALDFETNSVNVDCSPSLSPSVRVYKTASLIPFSIQGSRPMSHFRNIMTQPQRKKRNGTAAILGYSDYDASSEYNDNDTYNERDGLGTQPEHAPIAPSEIERSQSGIDMRNQPPSMTKSANQNAADTPIDPSVNLQQDTKVGNAGSVQPSDVIKKTDGTGNLDFNDQKQSVLPVDSSEETDPDDTAIRGPYQDPAITCSGVNIPLNETILSSGVKSYSFTFAVYIAGEDCEGLYNLYFHNCAEAYDSRVTLNVSLVEENVKKNYLSAGEMPLPALYFMMSILFFMAGCFWTFILKKSKRETGVAVFKIHYLMGALVFVKSVSLFFHSMNYHYIQTRGEHVEGWAVLYYIAHLLKGALLFITILLIGTGYAFVKHLLSDKDKKIFMIVIPLQVLANVAQIIIEESEEGEVVHTTWQVIFISVDLLCCCAILFPVVWSIRHLQEASQTDGKAASNLRKLKLFRHFYIIVVCYIYFTRIIVQMLLKITVPFQYEWLDDMFREMTTFIFFVLTGYKFRPAINNPYLELAHDSDEEMDVAMTESGLTEGAVKRGYKKKKTLKEIVLFDPNEEETDDDEEVLLEKRREASHDLD